MHSSVPGKAEESRIAEVRHQNHPDCILCSPSDGLGLGLNFVQQSGGDVIAEADCSRFFQGYTGVVHGGIVALLLDGAMTNCLFAAGITAMTAELNVRYLHSTGTGHRLEVRARLVRSRSPLHLVEAEVRQHGVVVARATAKFMEQ